MVPAAAIAQTPWTGGGGTTTAGLPSFNDAANWGGTSPASGLTMAFDGSTAAPSSVAIATAVGIGSLTFSNSFNPTNTLTLGLDNNASAALTLGQGLSANPTLISYAATSGTATIQSASLGTTASALLTLSVAQAGSISVAGGGTLAISSVISPASGAPSSAITKVGSGTLVLNSPANNTFVGLTIAGGTVRLDSGNYNTLGTVAGGLTLNNGTLLLNNTALGTTSRAVVLQGDATTNNIINVPAGHDVTFSGVVSGTGRLIKAGTGRMYLGSSTSAPIPVNTFSGGLWIQSGALRIGTTSSMGAGPVTLGSAGGGDTSIISNLAGYSYANNITVAAGTGGTVTLGSSSTFDANTTFSGTISLGSTLTVTAALSPGNFTQLSGVVSGTGGITKVGPGAVRLSATNTFNGAVTIDEGTLEGRFNNAFGNAANVITVNDGVLSFDHSTLTSGSISQSVQIANANSRVNVVTGETWTMNGAYTGSGTLTKIGAGTMYFNNAANTFSGPVALSQGGLRVNGTHNNAGSYSTVANTLLGGNGTINLATGSSMSIAGQLSPGNAGNAIGTLRINNGPVTLSNAGTPGTFLIEVNPDLAQRADQILVAASLNITDALLNISVINPGSPWTEPAIIATYGSLTGTFANESALNAAGFTLDYNYQGLNQIALLTIPEPTSLATAGLSLVGLLRRRRRFPR
jgi:fibronectin-binding autotransporter adhesin